MQKEKKILVKISGDLLFKKKVFQWFRRLCRENRYIVIVVGGGAQINEAFKFHGIRVRFGPAGRVAGSRGRTLAYGVLLKNKERVEEFLRGEQARLRGASVDVAIPVVRAGEVLCHLNGDNYVKTLYHGFDSLWVLTRKDLEETKRALFSDLPKVRVRAFS